MEKWILEVGTNCIDPAREAEFEAWYNDIHLPDVLEVAGFTGVKRYVNPSAGKGQARFLAIYEIETDDIEAHMKRHSENVARKREDGRMSDLLEIVSRALYRQTYSVMR